RCAHDVDLLRPVTGPSAWSLIDDVGPAVLLGLLGQPEPHPGHLGQGVFISLISGSPRQPQAFGGIGSVLDGPVHCPCRSPHPAMCKRIRRSIVPCGGAECGPAGSMSTASAGGRAGEPRERDSPDRRRAARATREPGPQTSPRWSSCSPRVLPARKRDRAELSCFFGKAV